MPTPIILFAVALAYLCGGCDEGREVDFVYFNLSTNEIWVTAIDGLPADASPGRLMPVQKEEQLSEKTTTFFRTVALADEFKIIWKEGGQNGWPSGLKPNELVPPGVQHELVLKRDDLKLPVKLTNGRVKFSYLGNDKWKVRVVSN